ncbi:MAG: hypothetical protein ACI976_002810 [Aureispira sp.]|jgi:hypothetical protein
MVIIQTHGLGLEVDKFGSLTGSVIINKLSKQVGHLE